MKSFLIQTFPTKVIMGLIERFIKKNRTAGALCAAVLSLTSLLCAGGALYAQNTVPVQLGMEIQQLEQRLSAGISPAERYDVLARLARLKQLSGSLASAAANWLDAVAADPNDDTALVSGAYCLAAIGEWEKAVAALRPLFDSGRWGPAMRQAQFLDAFLKARLSATNGSTAVDASALTALAVNPEFAAMRPMIYYTLWQTLAPNPGMPAGADAANGGSAELWKSRLLAEFPKSPEARAAGSVRIANPEKQKDSPSVSAVQSPLWLLFPGTAGSVIAEPVKPAEPAKLDQPVKSAEPVKYTEPAKPDVSSPSASTPVLQTGLFSKEANARSQAEALQKAGFSSFMSRKLVNGAEYWAVTVPAGQSQSKTIADLKKAGFDSFPVK